MFSYASTSNIFTVVAPKIIKRFLLFAQNFCALRK